MSALLTWLLDAHGPFWERVREAEVVFWAVMAFAIIVSLLCQIEEKLNQIARLLNDIHRRQA